MWDEVGKPCSSRTVEASLRAGFAIENAGAVHDGMLVGGHDELLFDSLERQLRYRFRCRSPNHSWAVPLIVARRHMYFAENQIIAGAASKAHSRCERGDPYCYSAARNCRTACGSLFPFASNWLTCHICVSDNVPVNAGIPVNRMPFATFQ